MLEPKDTRISDPSAWPTLRILVVDDDVELCELVAEYLKPDGFVVDAVYDGVEGLRRALSGDYVLMLLDEMLPGLKGLECLRRVRARSPLPIIMLTARGDFVDRILGLEMGADDYLPKPFNPRELVARIQAVLRRASADKTASVPAVEPIRSGDVQLDKGTRTVRNGAGSVELTSVEFDLLELFLKAAGETVSRDVIANAILGRELSPFDRTIDVHVSNLRRKLGPTSDGGQRIKAIRGSGYLYVSSPKEGSKS